MRLLPVIATLLLVVMVPHQPHQCMAVAQTFYGETFTTAKNVAGLTTSSNKLFLIDDDEEVGSIPLDKAITSVQSLVGDLDSPTSVLHLPVAGVLLIGEFKGIQRYTYSTSTLIKIAGGSAANNADGTGTAARMNQPAGLVAKADESAVYFVDTVRCVVRSMTYPGVVVTTLAGGTCGFADASGTSAQFQAPTAMALGASEASLIVADGGNNRLRSTVLSGNVVTTLACSGTAGSADGSALSASCNNPSGVVRIASSGVVFFVDRGSSILRRLSAGTVTTVLGTAGTTGTANGIGAAGLLNTPLSLAVDASGYLYIGQSGSNARVVRITISDSTPSPSTTSTTTAVPPTTTATPVTTTAVPVTTTGAPGTTTTSPVTTTGSSATTTAAPVTTTTAPSTTTAASTSVTVTTTAAPATTTEVPETTTVAPGTSTPITSTSTPSISSPIGTVTTAQPATTPEITTSTPGTAEVTPEPIQSNAPTTTVAVVTGTNGPDSSVEATSTGNPTVASVTTTAGPETATTDPSTLTPTTTTTAIALTVPNPETREPLPPVSTDANGADATPAVVGSLTLKLNVETARARATELQAAIADAAQVTTEAVTILAIVPGSAVVHFQIKTQRDPTTVSQNMSTSIQSGGALAAFAPVLETLTLQRKPGDALFAVGVTLYACIGLAIVALGASIGWSLYRRRNPDVVMKVKPTAALRSGAIYIDVKPDVDDCEGDGEEDDEKVELMRIGPNNLSKKSIRLIKSKDAQERSYLGLKATEGFVVDLDAQVEIHDSLSDDEGLASAKKSSPKSQEAGPAKIVNGGAGFRRNGSRRRFQGLTASQLPDLPPLSPLPAPRLSGLEMLQRLQPSREVVDGDLAAGYAMK